MQFKLTFKTSAAILFSCAILLYACGDKGGNTPPADPCAGVTVSVATTPTSPTTFGGSDGSINASASGGTGPFTYNINGGSFQNSSNFTGLAAGSYTIIAKNATGCTGTTTVVVVAPPNPCAGVTITVTAITANPSTAGGTNGTITATGSGGTGFTYSINNGPFQAAGNFTNLAAGTYTITAKSSAGCSGSASFTLTDPCAGVAVAVSGSVANPTTSGGTNGSITATASGGVAPYTFSLNNGAFQATGNFTGLAAGSYTVTAKTAAGCLGTANFTLTNPNPCAGVTIGVSNTAVNTIPCGTATGSITAAASGGVTPYTFSINNGPFQVGNAFLNLGAGSYTIVAKDANGCVGSSTATNVNNAAAGPLFTAVKTLIANNCLGCHSGAGANGGVNFAVDCNIVANKDRVKARAVDGTPSTMPPSGLLPVAERQKITDWLNAGGKFTD
jgi:hypothetical protein